MAVAFTIDNIDPCYGGKEVSHADKDKRKISFCCRVFSCHGNYSGPFFHTYMEFEDWVQFCSGCCGTVAGGLTGAIGDVVSAILFPVGAYFPGFTLTAFLTGAVFGWFFRNKVTVLNTALSVLVVQGIISQVMNTYWISFLYGSPFWPLFLTRIYQTAGMFVVQTAGIMLIEKKLMPVLRKYEMM